MVFNMLGSEYLINESSLSLQQQATVAMVGDNTLIGWENASGDNNGFGITSRLLPASQAWSTENQINVTTLQHQLRPSIATSQDGAAVAVWQSWKQDGSSWGVYARRMASDGIAVGGEVLVAQTTGGAQEEPDVAFVGADRFAVVWSGQGATDSSGVFLRIFSVDGTPLTGEIRVNSTVNGIQSIPTVARVGSSIAVAWQGSGVGDSAGVFSRVFDFSGTPISAEFRLNQFTSNEQSNVDVASIDATRFVATWQSRNQDGASWGVFANTFNIAGNSLATEWKVNETTEASQELPSAVATESTILIGWSGKGQIDPNGVFVREFSLNGVPTSSETSINQTSSGTQQNLQLALNGDRAIAVWDGRGPGDSNGVFGRYLQLSGSGNAAPSLESIPNQNVAEGSTVTLQVNAFDPDGDALNYSLSGNVPFGASLNSTTGQFQWTPTENDGPGVFEFNVIVADDGTPSLSASTPIRITVGEENIPPVLAPVADQSIRENELFNLPISAVDTDLPANTLVYSLLSAPTGATINSVTGQIGWPPTEFDGPSIANFTVAVSDGLVSVEQSFGVNVAEVNSAPNLEPIADQTIRENDIFRLSATAVDSDLPANNLVFTLIVAPSTATINSATGEISWQPTEADGPSVATFTVSVSDGFLAVEQSFNVSVADVNSPPIVEPIADQFIREHEPFALTVNAVDGDLPTNTLMYSLTSGPSGATINSGTGEINWLPTEADGPSVATFTVSVNDGVVSTERSFSVTVAEVNSAPALEPIVDQSIRENETFSLTISAVDIDVPANTLVYSLLTAPTGATINSATGQISWLPTESDGPSVASFTVSVSDGTITDAQSFAVNVAEVNSAPHLSEISDFTTVLDHLIYVAPFVLDSDIPADTFTFTLDEAPVDATIDGSTGRILWTPTVPGSYSFVLRATDDGGLSDTEEFAIHACGLDSASWSIGQSGGEPNLEGQVELQACQLVFHEGTSFNTFATMDLTVPSAPSSFVFEYSELTFDSGSLGSVRDAFEVALLDPNGNSLVHTIGQGRDAYFNVTEPGQVIAGVNTVVVDQSVSIDLSHLTPGTVARLEFRLLNNDADTQSTVRILPQGIVSQQFTTPSSASTSFAKQAEAVDTNTLAEVTQLFNIDYGTTGLSGDRDTTIVGLSASSSILHASDGPFIVTVNGIDNVSVTATNVDGVDRLGRPYYVLQGQESADSGVDLRTSLYFENRKGVQFDFRVSVFARANNSPRFTSTPLLETQPSSPYSYRAIADDADDEPLSFRLTSGPSAAVLNTSTGVFQWTPSPSDVGTHDIELEVIDGRGGKDLQSFSLNVVDAIPNRPPVITSVPPVMVDMGSNQSEYIYVPQAQDPDYDSVVFSLAEAPQGMTMDSNGIIRWTPTAGQGGTYGVSVTASDGQGGVTSQEYAVLVRLPSNQAPTFVSTPLEDFALPARSNPATSNVSPTSVNFELELGESVDDTFSVALDGSANVATSADIVFLVDESGSMQGEHDWLADTIQSIDVGLNDAGVTNNNYGLLGFGRVSYSNFFGFQPRRAFPHIVGPAGGVIAPDSIGDFAAGDVNGDGMIDLVTVNTMALRDTLAVRNGPSTLSVFLAESTTKFSAAQNYVIPQSGMSVKLADLNQDGHLDIVTANANSSAGSVSIYLGDGTGDFAIGTQLSFADRVNDLLLTDLNGDTLIDIALVRGQFDELSDDVRANTGGTLTLLAGLGDGSFNSWTDITLNSPGTSIESGDVNGDGIKDIVVGGGFRVSQFSKGGHVSVALGQSGGNYLAPIVTSHPSPITDIALGDLSSDGVLDVGVVDVFREFDGDGGNVSVYVGSSNGQFVRNGDLRYGIPTLGGRYSDSRSLSLDLSDIDQDGDLDFLVGSDDPQQLVTTEFFSTPQFSGGAFIVRGDGSGGFESTVDSFEVPGSTALGEDFSISFHAEAPSAFVRLLSSFDGGPLGTDDLYLDFDPTPALYSTVDGLRVALNQQVFGTAQPPTGADRRGYHHFALTVDSGTARVYLDGNEVANRFVGTGYSLSRNLLIGSDPNLEIGYPYRGSVDEFLALGRALSSTEIAQLATQPATTVVTPANGEFAVYYDFDGGTLEDKFILDGAQDAIAHGNTDGFGAAKFGGFGARLSSVQALRFGRTAMFLDFDNDGDQDILASGYENGTFGLHAINDGTGMFFDGAYDRILVGDADELFSATSQLITEGGFEDGYDAISSAVRYPLRPNAQTHFVLITDEAREASFPEHTLSTTLAKLEASGASLTSILQLGVTANGQNALGMQANGTTYLADSNGGFTRVSGGVAEQIQAYQDYAVPAFATEGSIWNLGILRENNLLTSESFSKAFVDSIVSQIAPKSNVTVVASDVGVQFENLTGTIEGISAGTSLDFDIKITSDGHAKSFDALFLDQDTGNILGSIPITIGAEYRTIMGAVDADGDSITYSLATAPSGAAIDSATGEIRWIPSAVGVYDFSVTADDGRGGTATQQFSVTVTSGVPNTAPSIVSTPPTTIVEQRQLSYQVVAADANGDRLDYYLAQSPDGMSIDRHTGRVTWTPTSADIGRSIAAQVRVLDGRGGEANQSLSLQVVQKVHNFDPEITSVPVTSAAAEQLYRYQLAAVDPDDDPLSFDLVIKPVGMTINGEGLISWRPASTLSSVEDVLVRVRDGYGGIDLQSFQISVSGDNFAPLFLNSPTGFANAGTAYSYQPTVIDPDGDEVHFVLEQAPGGMTLAGSGELNWLPNVAQLGAHTITLVAEDALGARTARSFVVDVLASQPSAAPTIISEPRTSIHVGGVYRYDVAASDPNNDVANYSLASAPAGMSIDADTGNIEWTPTPGQLGDHQIAIVVTDAQGNTAGQQFAIAVYEIQSNQVPTITSEPTFSATTDELYQYQVEATDPDHDVLYYALLAGPIGMVIDERSGLVAWSPAEYQTGSHEVAVEVFDGQGGSVRQSFTLTALPQNLPPQIKSSPVPVAYVGEVYRYSTEGFDPEGNDLVYSFVTRPNGMSIDAATGVVVWTPGALDVGSHTVSVKVLDPYGAGSTQTFSLRVESERPNDAPVFGSRPIRVALVDNEYAYNALATDSNGDAITFSLAASPTEMSIDEASGALRWTPTSDQTGNHTVSVVATDVWGAKATQTFNLAVRATNLLPTIHGTPPTTTTPGENYAYRLLATDAESDPLVFAVANGPAGLTIDQQGRISWTPSTGDLGSHPVSIAVSDPFGTATLNYTLTVGSDVVAPQVLMTFYLEGSRFERDGLFAYQNESLLVRVSASDNVGVASLSLSMGGVPLALGTDGAVIVPTDQLGLFDLVATATDAAGNQSVDTFSLLVADKNDSSAPQITFANPAHDAVVTSIIDITGTIVDDGELLSYKVEFAPVGSESFTTIRAASVGGSSFTGTLAQFDPTLLTNNSYTVRITALDAGGNRGVQEFDVHVEGALKVGNFTLSFQDLNIPVSGIPIVVARTYDSLNAADRGEFGYGWRMEFRDVDLRTSIAKTGLEASGIYRPFRDGARVYLTLPGGQREGFTFEARRATGLKGTLGVHYPVFVPDNGVHTQLTVTDYELAFDIHGNAVNWGTGLPWNPADPAFGGSFYATSREGLLFEIDGTTGDLQQVVDTNGNSLTYSENAVISSTGRQVQFLRDPQGRIAQIIDPEGNAIVYTYSSTGDLVSVTDREEHTTQLVYDSAVPHYLTKIIDPLGRTGIRGEYDNDGRLVRMFDALGNSTQLIHDLNNNRETIVDALGNSTTYVYDDRGNVLTEIDALGGETRRTYDEDNNELTITDPLGRTTVMTYNSAGDVLTETDPLGAITRHTYTRIQPTIQAAGISIGGFLKPFSLETQTVDPLGNSTAYNFDQNGNLLAIVDAIGQSTAMRYDENGNLTELQMPGVAATLFEYDDFGNQIGETDPLGHITRFTYDSNGNQLARAWTQTVRGVPKALTSSNSYDDEGRLVSTTDALGNVTHYEYDANGNQTAVIDPLGRRTETVYDDRGLVVDTIFADDTPFDLLDNPRTSTIYDALGRAITQLDELGRATHTVFDELGRVTENILPDDTPNDLTDNPRNVTEYDAAGQVVASIDPRGNRTEFEYDAAGRQTVIRDALGYETKFVFDAAGRQVSSTDANGHSTSFVFDSLGRLVASRFADGTVTRSEFNDAGRLAARIDQLGRVTSYGYDNLGRLTSVLDSNGGLTTYGYTETGGLVTQTDANGHTTSYEYDELGRRVAEILPRGQRSAQQYDAVGRMIAATDFNGETIVCDYDARDRLIAKRFPDATQTTLTYTLTGQRDSVIDARGVTNYAYDAQDRLLSRTDPDRRQINYTYDIGGNRTSVTVPSGTTSYTFDVLNRMETVTDPNAGVTTYGYDPVGLQVSQVFPNGVVETREYDSLNRLLYLQSENHNGTFDSYRYTLNAAGNRIAVTEASGRRVEYEYDSLDRLKVERIFDAGSPTATRTLSYDYDPAGNRLSRIDTAEGTTLYVYDNNDRLLQETNESNVVQTQYTYDSNGSTITKTTDGTTVRYGWDFERRLVEIDLEADGTVDVANEYNVDGFRVSRLEVGEKTLFLIDENRPYSEVLEEYLTSGVVVVSYVHGIDLISQEQQFGQRFYHADGLGSTRALTDISGEATDRYIYDAYGRAIEQEGLTSNAYLFGGEPRDSATGLDYLRSRWMNSSSGRFINRDEFEGFRIRPRTLHRYIYASGNPANQTDPSGLTSLSEVTATLGTVTRLTTTVLRTVSFIGRVRGFADLISTARDVSNLFSSGLLEKVLRDQFKQAAIETATIDVDAAVTSLLSHTDDILLYSLSAWTTYLTPRVGQIDRFVVYLPQIPIPVSTEIPFIKRGKYRLNLLLDNKGSGRVTGVGVGFGKKKVDQIWRMDKHTLHPGKNPAKDAKLIVDRGFHYHIRRPPQ